jgi:hypothetical protein
MWWFPFLSAEGVRPTFVPRKLRIEKKTEPHIHRDRRASPSDTRP